MAEAARKSTTPRKRGVTARRTPKHKRLKFPPLPAEQAHVFKELARREREARTHAAWMADIKELDRALAAEVWGRQSERKKRRKTKRLLRVGAQPEHDTDGGITAAAKAVAERGVDDTRAKFIDRVYLELQGRHIKAPGLTWMNKHMKPIYERARRKARPKSLNR